jgi:hypothetical protein
MKPSTTFLAASAGILLLGAGVPIASAQADIYGTRQRPLEGRRYETMRALAHYLDESSQSALETFTEAAKNRSGERKLLPQVQDFARRADSFHSLMDNYEANRRDVPPQVNDLLNRARRINSRLNSTYIGRSTREGWTDVIDVMDKMKRVVAGEEVDVPMAHGNLEDYDRDYGMFGGVRRTRSDGAGIGLTGYRLEQFQRLAHELDQNALRSHQIAETNRATYGSRQQEFLSDLRRFAERAHDVHVRADADSVDPREMAPIVSRLLQDARDTDRSLRDTRVFPEVWDQWGQTIDVLNQMADLVRQ